MTIKVSSTETSHIFGNIVFDTNNNVDTTVLNLNDINIDIMDYIRPATSSDVLFRSMWAEFEWENKVHELLMHYTNISIINLLIT